MEDNNTYTVYLISSQIGESVLYKIGWTKRTPEDRIKEMTTGNASNMMIVDSYKSKWGTKIEKHLHRLFYNKRVSGEWFDLDKSDVEEFKNLCDKFSSNLDLIESENSWYNEKINKRFF